MTNPPPGWYSHIDNPTPRRWWDGEKWTEHLEPIARDSETSGGDPLATDQSPKAGGPALIVKDGSAAIKGETAMAGRRSPATNPLAVTGFVLGIAGFFLFGVPILGLFLTMSAALVSAAGLHGQSPEAPKKYWVFGIIGLILGLIYFVMALVAMFEWGRG